MKKVAIQLYSIRDLMEKDVFSTLEAVKKAGYAGVEFAGYFGVSSKAMRAKLDELGLVTAGTHTGLTALTDDKIDETIAYNLELGNKYVVVPGMPAEMFESYDACLRTAELFAKLADKIETAGMKLYYHNHNSEFKQYNGKYILDILMENAPKLGMELDCYWIAYAGIDPLPYMQKYGKRCDLLHIKDMLGDEKKTCTEVGNGIIDYKSIFAEGKKNDTKWYILEQEAFAMPELDSIAISAKFMNEHC